MKYQVYIWKNRWSSFRIKWILFHVLWNFYRNDVYIWIKHKCVPCVFGKISIKEKQLKSFKKKWQKKRMLSVCSLCQLWIYFQLHICWCFLYCNCSYFSLPAYFKANIFLYYFILFKQAFSQIYELSKWQNCLLYHNNVCHS